MTEVDPRHRRHVAMRGLVVFAAAARQARWIRQDRHQPALPPAWMLVRSKAPSASITDEYAARAGGGHNYAVTLSDVDPHVALNRIYNLAALRQRWASPEAAEQLAMLALGLLPRSLLQPHRSPRSVRRDVSARTRYLVLVRDRSRCRLCGLSADDEGVVLHVDHIVPVAAGGSNDEGNLRTLCADCNLGKGATLGETE